MYYNTLTNSLHSEASLQKLGMFPNPPEFIKKLTNEKPYKDPALYLVTESGYDLTTYEVTYEVKLRSLQNVLDVLKDRTKNKRVQVEQGGIVITGTDTKLDSTRVDGQMIHNAYVGLSNLMPDAIIDFYSASGWVTITVDVLKDLFLLYSAHVEDCFKREKHISDLLDTAESSEQALEIYNAEIDNGWPTC